MLNIEKIKKLNYDFDSNFSHISDFDLIVRLFINIRSKIFNKVLSGWRIHGNNQSFKKKIYLTKKKNNGAKYI